MMFSFLARAEYVPSDVSLGANSGKGGFQGMLGKEYRGADKSGRHTRQSLATVYYTR
jgi:hypothetical protein